MGEKDISDSQSRQLSFWRLLQGVSHAGQVVQVHTLWTLGLCWPKAKHKLPRVTALEHRCVSYDCERVSVALCRAKSTYAVTRPCLCNCLGRASPFAICT